MREVPQKATQRLSSSGSNARWLLDLGELPSGMEKRRTKPRKATQKVPSAAELSKGASLLTPVCVAFLPALTEQFLGRRRRRWRQLDALELSQAAMRLAVGIGDATLGSR